MGLLVLLDDWTHIFVFTLPYTHTLPVAPTSMTFYHTRLYVLLWFQFLCSPPPAYLLFHPLCPSRPPLCPTDYLLSSAHVLPPHLPPRSRPPTYPTSSACHHHHHGILTHTPHYCLFSFSLQFTHVQADITHHCFPYTLPALCGRPALCCCLLLLQVHACFSYHHHLGSAGSHLQGSAHCHHTRFTFIHVLWFYLPAYLPTACTTTCTLPLCTHTCCVVYVSCLPVYTALPFVSAFTSIPACYTPYSWVCSLFSPAFLRLPTGSLLPGLSLPCSTCFGLDVLHLPSSCLIPFVPAHT